MKKNSPKIVVKTDTDFKEVTLENWPVKSTDSAGYVALLEDTQKKYNELIMAVESKFPGESRHDTALRYIQDRENGVVCTSGEVKLTDAKPIKLL